MTAAGTLAQLTAPTTQIGLSELTKVPVKRVMDGKELVPDAVVVRLTDDWLFRCQFLLMEDAGTARFTDAEVERLRAYLLKGGFLLSSDYHGSYAKAQFDEEIGRVLPHGEFPIVDLTPPTHPIWHTMFEVNRIPQMASIQTWRRSGKSTIERWNEDGSPPDVRGIADDHGRDQGVTDLGHRADQFDVCRLEHRVRPLHEGNESAGFDHSNCLCHIVVFRF